ncbi:epoxide hydrolase family protein [Nonomuraea ferruginea]
MTRFADEIPGADQGVPVSRVQRLVSYWRDGFDWRAVEARLNAHPQFVTEIDGQDIHFVHVRSDNPDALPLILTHGWPGSFAEYLDAIEPLSRHFHLVVPSLPGYGFSGPTRELGWNNVRIARAWAELMARLGYTRYGAVGNDASSMISPEIGRVDPGHCVGVHVTQLFSFPSGDPAEFAGLSEEDQQGLAVLDWFWKEKGAFNVLHSQQPQTLAHALMDSPLGPGRLAGPALRRGPGRRLRADPRRHPLVHRHRRVGAPALLGERPRRAAQGAHDGADRAGDGRGRLQVDPAVRGPRPHPDRLLEDAAQPRPAATTRPTPPRTPSPRTSATSSSA